MTEAQDRVIRLFGDMITTALEEHFGMTYDGATALLLAYNNFRRDREEATWPKSTTVPEILSGTATNAGRKYEDHRSGD